MNGSMHFKKTMYRIIRKLNLQHTEHFYISWSNDFQNNPYRVSNRVRTTVEDKFDDALELCRRHPKWYH